MKKIEPKLILQIKKSIIIFSGLIVILPFQNCSEFQGQSSINLNSGDEQSEPIQDPPETPPTPPANCSVNNALAFPGAFGFGKNTIGGRGGRIVHVTNLNNSGGGSLRWALEGINEPRIVVFDVEGRINLNEEISVRNPYVTVAGQTAPGDGIVITGGRIHVRTKEVILRGLKIRPGDDPSGDIGRARDSISIGRTGVTGIENVVVDHNSLTWAVDETLSIWGTVNDVTLSNNLIAEALYDSIHVDEGKTETAPHSTGMIIGHKDGEPSSVRITVARNFFASINSRNPYIKAAQDVEFLNNFINNPGLGHQAANLGSDTAPVTISVIGNYWEDGIDSGNDERPAISMRSAMSGSEVHFSDNFVEGHGDASDPVSDKVWGMTQYIVNSIPFSISNTPLMSSSQTKNHVLDNVGARNPAGELDLVDQRIVREVKAGTSRIIDSQQEVGGYSSYDFRGRTVQDSDGDGMPDSYEIANSSKGLNPNRADDKADFDNDGYTNIEEYINGLISGFELSSCEPQ